MLNECILILAVSIDTFIVALSCGADCIKIPIKSAICVGLVGTIIMMVSLYFSEVVSSLIPINLCSAICCGVLCAMGGINILKWAVEKHKRYKYAKKNLLEGDQNNILDVFICGSCADCDHSKEISIKEAIMVSFLMSLDTLVCGIAGGSDLNSVVVIIGTLLFQSVTVWGGSLIGKKFSKIPDVSFVGGLLLIILGISKVI